MPPDSCLFEIHSACLNLTLPTQSWRPQTAPSFPQWRAPWPLSIHAAPAYGPLLGTEARPTVQPPPAAVRTIASVPRLEHFFSPAPVLTPPRAPCTFGLQLRPPYPT